MGFSLASIPLSLQCVKFEIDKLAADVEIQLNVNFSKLILIEEEMILLI